MKSLLKIKDNSCSDPQEEKILSALHSIAGVPVKELVTKNPGLLIFPASLGEYKDGIEDTVICSLAGDKVQTNNIVGFIGVNDCRLCIHSRFDSSEKQFFLHYLLQRVFGINLFDFSTGIDPERIWDFLIYLFPFCLKKALTKGLFRTYRDFKYNNDHVRGSIDIARHIKQNIPFTGKIAYQTREYTANNHLLQLVRYTIDVIRKKRYSANILSSDCDIRDAVLQIECATPDYNQVALSKVIAQNLRPVRHPYYTEYTVLQKLCLQILRHEKISFGSDDNEIYGVLFDAAFLWEEYLNTLLSPLGFIHPKNKARTNAISLYSDRYLPAYPDFIGNGMILDAKYKRLDGSIGREDRFQMISYLHVTKYSKGILLHPSEDKEATFIHDGCLAGLGGSLGVVNMHIPQNVESFSHFIELVQTEEDRMLSVLQKQFPGGAE